MAAPAFTAWARERYATARAEPRDAAAGSGAAATVDAGADDAQLRAKTGHSWDEWVELIDAGPGRGAGHTAIATWVRENRGVDAWWAQGVTVGYERLTGLRLPGQMPDGTFTVSRSRTLAADGAATRALLLDDIRRAALLPGLTSTLRSSAEAKQLRFDLCDAADGAQAGVVGFTLDPAKTGVKLVVTHEKLTSAAAGDVFKRFWGDWLAALELPA